MINAWVRVCLESCKLHFDWILLLTKKLESLTGIGVTQTSFPFVKTSTTILCRIYPETMNQWLCVHKWSQAKHNTQIYALVVLIFNDEQYFYIDGNMVFVTLVEALTRLARPVALVATSADTSSSVTSETGLILQSLS